MTRLPATTAMQMGSIVDSWDPAVERTEMERGVPKQRLVNSNVLAKLKVTLYFRTSADADEFDDWYFNDIKRIGWFDVNHPRTGKLLSVRFEGGAVGDLTLIDETDFDTARQVVMEYLR